MSVAVTPTRAGLDPDGVRRLGEVLSGFPALRLAIVYGSMARGGARVDSDLDLAVLADRPLTAGERIAVVTAVSEATHRPVDLVDLATAGEPTLGQVLRHGRRVLGSSATHGDLLFRHLVDQSDFAPLRNRVLDERLRAWTRT